MTNHNNYDNTKEWIHSMNRSHNHDYRVIALVKLLARQAAQEDYDNLLINTNSQSPAENQKETLQ